MFKKLHGNHLSIRQAQFFQKVKLSPRNQIYRDLRGKHTVSPEIDRPGHFPLCAWAKGLRRAERRSVDFAEPKPDGVKPNSLFRFGFCPQGQVEISLCWSNRIRLPSQATRPTKQTHPRKVSGRGQAQRGRTDPRRGKRPNFKPNCVYFRSFRVSLVLTCAWPLLRKPSPLVFPLLS